MDITVIGTSEYALPPERGTVDLHLLAEDSDPRRAATRVQTETARIDAELRGLAQAENAPVTWFSVAPLTTSSWQPTTQKGTLGERRYRASATIRAKFANFTVLAERVAAWGASEVTNVQHVRWTLTDATRLRIEASALGEAVEDARQRAAAIAQACGLDSVQIVEVADPGLLSVGSGSVSGPVTALGAMARGKAPETTELTPEDVTGGATVHARLQAS